MFARHRCRRLLSSGAKPTARDVWSMFAHSRCHRLLFSGSDPTARNVWPMFARHRVAACDCRGSGPFATTIAAMCGHGLTSSLTVIACVCRGSNPFITTIVSMCGQRPHVMTGCHRLWLSGITPFSYCYRQGVCSYSEASSLMNACHRLHVVAVIAFYCRGSNPVATTIVAPGSCSPRA